MTQGGEGKEARVKWNDKQSEDDDQTRKEVESNPQILSAQASQLSQGLTLCMLPG